MEIIRKEEFDRIKSDFVALIDENTFKKEVSFAIQAFNGNSYLNGTTTESKLRAVMNISQTGLTLNPVLKLAYLIPRTINGKRECCLDPSYQGLVKLITDTGSARNVYSHLVYKGDIFEESLGTSVELIHKPKRESKEITNVYAVAVLQDGQKQIEVMTIEQVNEIRDKSESYKAFKNGKNKICIWELHYGEMARKTVIRRLCKYLPKTDQWERLAQANELIDQDYKSSWGQREMASGLLDTSVYDERQRHEISMEIEIMTSSRASEIIQDLKNNQLNPVESGVNYGQKDIQKQLDNH